MTRELQEDDMLRSGHSHHLKVRMTTIAILDDDHVIRLTRYAISGPGEVTTDWAREFFMPENVDPARVYALGDGLHARDSVALIPMSAKVDLRKGSDAAILIFRRGSIDSALMDSNPKLKVAFVGPPVTVEPEKTLLE